MNSASEDQQDLDHAVYQLGEISVTPGRFSIDDSKLSPYLIPKSQMERLPLIDNDISRATHTLPGVIADDFSARFSLRGGDRDEIIVRLDGMELFDPYHLQDFGGAMSVIDMGIVKRANLFTGGFPAEYGDAMSGVFDITSREGNEGKTKGDVGVDLLNTHFILEIPSSKMAWLLAGRRGYIDLLMGLIESEETFNPQYYDIYSKLDYALSPSDNLSVHVLYAGDTNEIDQIGEENDLTSRYWNGLLFAKWNHLIGEKTLWDLFLFSGNAGGRKHEGIDGIDERSLSFAGLKGDFSHSFMPSQTLKAGWRCQTAKAKYDYFLREDDVVTSVSADPKGWDLNGYVQDEWRIGDRVGGNLGLRYIYQDYGGYFNVMPRVSIAIKPQESLIIRSAWGLYYQPVQITDLPVEEGISESQPPEKATHYLLSFEYFPISNLFIKTEAYYKTLGNLVGRIKDYGRKERFFISPKSGLSRGIELYAKHAPLPNLSWGLGYALSKTEVDTSEGNIPGNFDRRHSLNLSASYQPWVDGWINVVWRFHTGDPYTPAWYEKVATENGDSFVWQKRYGTVNGNRYPPYHSLDVRLTKNFQFKSYLINLYLQILNLYNRKNVHEYSFEQMEDNEGKIYYQKVTEHFLPFLPSLGLNVRF